MMMKRNSHLRSLNGEQLLREGLAIAGDRWRSLAPDWRRRWHFIETEDLLAETYAPPKLTFILSYALF